MDIFVYTLTFIGAQLFIADCLIIIIIIIIKWRVTRTSDLRRLQTTLSDVLIMRSVIYPDTRQYYYNIPKRTILYAHITHSITCHAKIQWS